MYVIQDVEAWCPAIRSKSAIKSTNKREFVDPSLVVAALGVEPNYFNLDLKNFGFIFETLPMPKFKNIKDLPDLMEITEEKIEKDKETARNASPESETSATDCNAELIAKLLANPEMAALLKTLTKNL